MSNTDESTKKAIETAEATKKIISEQEQANVRETANKLQEIFNSIIDFISKLTDKSILGKIIDAIGRKNKWVETLDNISKAVEKSVENNEITAEVLEGVLEIAEDLQDQFKNGFKSLDTNSIKREIANIENTIADLRGKVKSHNVADLSDYFGTLSKIAANNKFSLDFAQLWEDDNGNYYLNVPKGNKLNFYAITSSLNTADDKIVIDLKALGEEKSNELYSKVGTGGFSVVDLNMENNSKTITAIEQTIYQKLILEDPRYTELLEKQKIIATSKESRQLTALKNRQAFIDKYSTHQESEDKQFDAIYDDKAKEFIVFDKENGSAAVFKEKGGHITEYVYNGITSNSLDFSRKNGFKVGEWSVSNGGQQVSYSLQSNKLSERVNIAGYVGEYFRNIYSMNDDLLKQMSVNILTPSLKIEREKYTNIKEDKSVYDVNNKNVNTLEQVQVEGNTPFNPPVSPLNYLSQMMNPPKAPDTDNGVPPVRKSPSMPNLSAQEIFALTSMLEDNSSVFKGVALVHDDLSGAKVIRLTVNDYQTNAVFDINGNLSAFELCDLNNGESKRVISYTETGKKILREQSANLPEFKTAYDTFGKAFTEIVASRSATKSNENIIVESWSKVDKAVEAVIDSGEINTSVIQKKLGVGYNEAQSLMIALEKTNAVKETADGYIANTTKEEWYASTGREYIHSEPSVAPPTPSIPTPAPTPVQTMPAPAPVVAPVQLTERTYNDIYMEAIVKHKNKEPINNSVKTLFEQKISSLNERETAVINNFFGENKFGLFNEKVATSLGVEKAVLFDVMSKDSGMTKSEFTDFYNSETSQQYITSLKLEYEGEIASISDKLEITAEDKAFVAREDLRERTEQLTPKTVQTEEKTTNIPAKTEKPIHNKVERD